MEYGLAMRYYWILLLFLAGCGTEALPLDGVSCDRCPLAMVSCEDCAEAIAFWNRETGLNLLERGDNGNISIGFIDPWLDTENDAYAFTDSPLGCEILINAAVAGAWWLEAHEIGHCLGLPHSLITWSIMFPETNALQHVTPQDFLLLNLN